MDIQDVLFGGIVGMVLSIIVKPIGRLMGFGKKEHEDPEGLIRLDEVEGKVTAE